MRYALLLMLVLILGLQPTDRDIIIAVTDAPRGMAGAQCRRVAVDEFICHGEPPYILNIDKWQQPRNQPDNGETSNW